MSDEIKLTNPTANQILIYDDIQDKFVNVEPSLSLFGTNDIVTNGLSIGTGEPIFNDTLSNTMRFKSLVGDNGIQINNLGSNIQIRFDGDAQTLGGLDRDSFLKVSNDLSDIDPVAGRANLDVYSIGDAHNNFLEANATNIPDLDNEYDIGSNGRRFADVYAVTFHGLATEAIVSQTIDQKDATDGQILVWSQADQDWIAQDSQSSRLNTLVDVDANNIQHESVLVYNGTRNKWETAPLSSITGSGTGGTGGFTDAENVGTGVGTFYATFGSNLQFRSISAGNNITIDTNFNGEEIVVTADVPQTTDDLAEGTTNLYYTDQKVANFVNTISIQDLGSTSTTAPVSGQAPVWNGSIWQFRDVAVDITNTDDLPEGTTNQYFTQARTFTSIDNYLAEPTKGITVSQLKDTNVDSTVNTFLKFTGTQWINSGIAFNDLSDVSISSVSDQQVLAYDVGSGLYIPTDLPQTLEDLQETANALYFNSSSLSTLLSQKTTDDLPESATRKYLTTSNLQTTLDTVSIGDLGDVDISTVSNNNVLVWNATAGTFEPADASSLNVTVNMSIGDLNDVNSTSIANVQDGYVIKYNTSLGEFEATASSTSLNEITDVSLSSLNDGEGIVYEGGIFVNKPLVPYDNTVSPVDNYILQYSSVDGAFIPVDPSATLPNTLEDLANVTISGSYANNDLLVYDIGSSEFTNKQVSDFVNIGDLTNVTLGTLQTNDILRYNGTTFVNELLPTFDTSNEQDNFIFSYDTGSGNYVSESIYDTLNINYTAPTEGQSFIYDGTNNEFVIRNINVSDLGDVNSTSPQDGHILTFNNTSGDYENQSIYDALNINYSAPNNNEVFIYDAVNSEFVVSGIELNKLSDINITQQNDQETYTIRWNATGSTYDVISNNINALNDVNAPFVRQNQALLYDETNNEFIRGSVLLSYEENAVRNSSALESWSFTVTDGSLILGQNEVSSLIPESGYGSYSTDAVGIYGTNALSNGDDFTTPETQAPKSLWADLGIHPQSEVGTLSIDFWFDPISTMVYSSTTKATTTIAGIALITENIGEGIVAQLEIKPEASSGNGFFYNLVLMHNNSVVQETPIDIPDLSGLSHIAITYENTGTQSIINCYVNKILAGNIITGVIIGSDTNYSILVTTGDQVESGSEHIIVDGLSVYTKTLSTNDIERNYNAVIGNGHDYHQEVSNINDLNDVDTTGLTTGQVLSWDGTNFTPETISSGATQLSGLTDVDNALAPTNGQALIFNSTGGYFEAQTLNIPVNINDLGDVDTTSISTGQGLSWDGTNFIPTTFSTVTQLSGLSDVDNSLAPNDGDSLVYNSTSGLFEAQAVSGSGATQLSELSDVNNALSPTDGQVLSYDATNGYFVTETLNIPSNIEDLNNVDTTGISTGQGLSWDGTNFVPTSFSGGVSSLSDLTDVNNALAPTDGQVLSYDGANGYFVTETLNVPSAISDLSDVDSSGVTTGQVLSWDGTNFTPETLSSGATQLSGLTDVDNALAPTDGQVLSYDSTNGYFVTETLNIPVNISDLNDVDITGATSGDALIWDGTQVSTTTLTIPSTISDLSDVDSSGVTTGQVLSWDGTNFTPETLSTGATQLSGLSDVDNALAPTDGQALIFNSTAGYFEAQTLSTGATSINELSDVDTTGLTTGQALTYDGTNFTPSNLVTGINDLSDVSASGATTDQVLRWNGTAYDPVTLNLAYMSDVNDALAPTDGQVLVYNSTAGYFEAQTLSTGATSINELSDVDTTGLSSGDVLSYDGTNFTPQALNIPATINDLSDVDTTGIVTNQVLAFDGTNFVAASLPPEINSINDIADVDTTGLTTGQVLSWDGTNFTPETLNIPTSASDLSDIDTSGVTDGQVLAYNSTTSTFEPSTVSSGATSLGDLTDFDGTITPSDGDVVTYDSGSGQYVPAAPTGGGGSTAGHEWVSFLFTSGSSGNLSGGDSLQSSTSGVTVNIVDGANGIVEFTFTGKPYPPTAIMSYGQATSTNEFNMNNLMNYGTRKVSGGGTTTSPALFDGSFTQTITLELTMATTGSSAGFGERAHMYIMFMFGE